ncbi:MAG: serine/threonine-protein phosphatase [Rhodobacteraceae bacterium]|nr:serine/threonine-protein phosphatase [Paracoccaceae bacterium]
MSYFHHCAQTDVGKVRKINEDSMVSVPELGAFLVADGMGGHSGGDFASQTLVARINQIDRNLPSSEVMKAMRAAILEAHYAILEEADRRGSGAIGTTAVGLVLAEPHFVCLWVGDSRLYHCRNGKMVQLSRDHSLVNDLLESGQITEAEVENHPHGNVITRAVGVGETLEIDKLRGTYEPGDRFLLCSDGLSGFVTDEVIGQFMATAPMDTICGELINLALEGGGRDNITAIVIEIPDHF